MYSVGCAPGVVWFCRSMRPIEPPSESGGSVKGTVTSRHWFAAIAPPAMKPSSGASAQFEPFASGQAKSSSVWPPDVPP